MRRTPLQVMFSAVKVTSRADGVLEVTPQWDCGEYKGPELGGGPGLFTRMKGAERLEKFINAHLKQGKA